jgi:DNA polymerase-1
VDWETRDVNSDPDFGKDERGAIRVKQRSDYEFKEVALKLIDLIQKVQTCTTLLSSHIEGRRKYINPISRRIHAGYTQWTETGRLNSQNPNQQNVPAPHNDDLKIRKLYVAPPGKVLFLIDFSGFELRILSWRAKDSVKQEIFCNDGDMHRKTAATATGKPESEITDVERKHAKPVNFGRQTRYAEVKPAQNGETLKGQSRAA